MGWYICQVLLDFLHFSEAEPGFVWLIVHFEIFDLLKLLRLGPLHRFVAFLLLTHRLHFIFFLLLLGGFSSPLAK